MSNKINFIEAERLRIQAEYQRREREVNSSLYASWQPAESLMRSQRKHFAAMMLHAADVFPKATDQCLEVGYGSLGWLGDLITWGVKETSLHGIELDERRAKMAREILPAADLRLGDATSLPWGNDGFNLVIASTIFTSILNPDVRRIIAEEITRVLKPGGALLFYDFAANNPRNPHVRKVTRKDLGQLFPLLKGRIKSVTLAPPLARLTARRSILLAHLLESIPFLQTHLLAVLVKS